MQKLVLFLTVLFLGITSLGAHADEVKLSVADATNFTGGSWSTTSSTRRYDSLKSCTIGDFKLDLKRDPNSPSQGTNPYWSDATDYNPSLIRFSAITELSITAPEGVTMERVVVCLNSGINETIDKVTAQSSPLTSDTSAKTWTWNGTTTDPLIVKFEKTDNTTGAFQIKEVDITYTPKDQNDFAAKIQDSYNLTLDTPLAMFDGETILPPGLAFDGYDTSFFTVDESATITPVAVTSEPAAVKATWSQGNGWGAGQKNFTVTISDKPEFTAENIPDQTVALNRTLDINPLLPEGQPTVTEYIVEPATLGTITEGVFHPSQQGEGVIIYRWARSAGYRAGESSFSISVTAPDKSVDVVLTKESFFGDAISSDTFSNPNYTNVSYTDPATGIAFTAYCASVNNTLFLRYANQESGIMTVANPNGYMLRSVSIVWSPEFSLNSNTRLEIFGKEEGYAGSNAAQLYDENTQGEKLVTLEIPSPLAPVKEEDFKQYPYIGIRSYNGRQAIESITLTFIGTVEAKPDAVNIYVSTVENPASLKDAKTTISIAGAEGESYSATISGGGIIDAPLRSFKSGDSVDLTYYTDINGVMAYTSPEIDDNALAANTLYTIKVAGVNVSILTPPAVKTERISADTGMGGPSAVYFEEGGDATIYYKNDSDMEDIAYAPQEEGTISGGRYIEYDKNVPIELAATGILSFYSAATVGDKEIKSPVISFTPKDMTTGIDDIDADKGQTIIYDLQGRRISPSNLAPGLYIQIQGRKAQKIIII